MSSRQQAENPVLESARYIAENAVDVQVSKDGCEKAAETVYQAMLTKEYSTHSWSKHALNPDPEQWDPIKVVDWIFTVDLLNFSFWSDVDDKDTGDGQKTQRYSVEYNGQWYTGYWSLVAAINKALDMGVDVTTPANWIGNSIDFAQVFASETTEQIPLLEERIAVLKEAGQVMQQLGYKHFAELVAASDKSAINLLRQLTSKFPSFNDQSNYHGRPVKIFKRAQILISDIWACFNGQGYGQFDDIDQLTMFADYRVPQILKSLKCLSYSNELISHLTQLKPIPHGDSREVELRGCSIWSVEIIKQAILDRHPEAHINSILLDFYLWDTAKELQKQHGGDFEVPCHRTRSIYY